MKAEAFWEAKLRTALHDPPHKPFVLKSGTGGHAAAARALLEQLLGEGVKPWYAKNADFAASGADRPVLNQARGVPGGVLTCDFTTRPLVTHSLMGGVALEVPVPTDAEAKPHEVARQQVEAALKTLEALDSGPGHTGTESEGETLPSASLAAAATVEETFWWVWRAWRDNLSMPDDRTIDPLWDLLPADSRCPDHPIWEHLRVAGALAFLGVRDRARHPWLLSVSVGPVQAFIRESRTFRDLWMSSFLLSELAFAAMEPFIERYGPDCILYPDLRGNARMDVWMHRHRPHALPPAVVDPRTQAALIPDSFVVLVPQGPAGDEAGASHLRHLQEMAEDSRRSMQARWRALCGLVERWIQKTTGRPQADPSAAPPWKKLWERQIAQGPQLAWSAVKWERPADLDEKVANAESLRRRESLPAQAPHPSSERAGADQERIGRRRARLGPWLPVRIAAHYEQAREVFGAVNLNYVQNERGFDYPIVHHVLRTRHRLRAHGRHWPSGRESGEKCTLCGKRQALSDRPDERHIDKAREEARNFWRVRNLDPEETGAERLCAVCSVKRFLVVASGDADDEDEAGLGPVLFGSGWRDELDGGRLRTPFPSTSVVALQDYFAWAVEAGRGAALHEALRATDLDRTNHPRALVRLSLALRDAKSSGDLLKYDAQYAMPHTLDAEIRWAKEKKEKLQKVRVAARELYKSFCSRHRPSVSASPRAEGAPDPRVAVVRLDVDRLGRLVLGDPERIAATWRDVLHPATAERLQDPQPDDNLQWAIDAGWPRLLGRPRHMGPSLHAFITRALAVFANTIVPWVVEREYGGRLLYAGGDDVLVIAPAGDALRLAARLQQLFSAPWVVDTCPREQPWSWRGRDWAASVSGSAADLRAEAQRRFVVPKRAPGAKHIVWPVRWAERHCDPGAVGEDVGQAADEPSRAPDVEGRVHAMLGRGQSLSAGIAYSHYKTDLRLLVEHTRYLLDDIAKDRCGGAAVAVGHFTRNGAKSEFAMPWSDGSGPPAAQRRLLKVIDGFRCGTLPGRLPYKLRDLTDLALAESASERRPQKTRAQVPSEAFLRGLLATALDAKATPCFRDAVIDVWTQGFRLHGAAAQPLREPAPERAVDGLLFCRALAGPGDDR